MTIEEVSKIQVIAIYVLGALALGATLLRSKFKKVEVESRTIFKFYRSSHDVNIYRGCFLLFLFILIFELYLKPKLFTSLFLGVILYHLYLSIQFAKFEANKRLLYHKDFDLYEYYSNDKKITFFSKDIKSVLVRQPLHPFGKFKIANIELENTVLRITEHLFDFDKVAFFEGKNVAFNKPSLKFDLGDPKQEIHERPFNQGK